MTELLQFTALGFLTVVILAWICEAYRSGNRFWTWVRDVLIEYLYEQVYLGAWRAMMRHSDDPALTYNGRHFK